MSRYHLSLSSLLVRTALASAGGFALAFTFCAGAAVLLGRAFDMARGEAVVLTAMLAFLMWMMAVLVAYAATSTWRAVAWILGGIALFGALAWGLGPLPLPGSA
jgi:hypothetical protein